MNRVANLLDCGVQFHFAICVQIHVLHRTLIGLDTRKFQAGCCVDQFGDVHDVLGCVHTATARAAVDFDQGFDLRASSDCRVGQVFDVLGIIHTDQHTTAILWHLGKAFDLCRLGHLVGNHHVLDAAAREHFGLRYLLAAHTDRGAHVLL